MCKEGETRRIRYQVACSLDGYIAGPNGEFDWIIMDPEIDFGAMFTEYDTLLMGRATYQLLGQNEELGGQQYAGMKIVVFSRTLRQADHSDVTIVSDDIKARLDEIRTQPGKDIWLFGGGMLFQSLFELDLVDTVEPAVIPIVLGAGIPMFPSPTVRRSLRLTGEKRYDKTGTLFLQYAVIRAEDT